MTMYRAAMLAIVVIGLFLVSLGLGAGLPAGIVIAGPGACLTVVATAALIYELAAARRDSRKDHR